MISYDNSIVFFESLYIYSAAKYAFIDLISDYDEILLMTHKIMDLYLSIT